MNRIRHALPYPSKLWLQFLWLLKVSIAVALLIVGLGLPSCAKQNLALTGTPLQWQNAASVVPQAEIQSVLQQVAFTPLIQQQPIPVQAARLQGKQEIVFLNFSQFPGLCGELGCLVAAYFAQNPDSLIWGTHVSPHLPTKLPLLAQFNDQAVPSFIVNQLDGTRIRQILYTWDGSAYQPEKSVIN
jgi:hypothetical protein